MSLNQKRCHPVDIHVGAKIREARNIRGLSQSELGKALEPSVSFQQIQKYELGANRVTAGRIWEIAKALDVEVIYFFGSNAETSQSKSLIRDATVANEIYFSPDEIELVRIYRDVEDVAVKGRVRELVRAVAEQLTDD